MSIQIRKPDEFGDGMQGANNGLLSMAARHSGMGSVFSAIQASASSTSDGMAALTEFNRNLAADSNAASMVATIQANATGSDTGQSGRSTLN